MIITRLFATTIMVFVIGASMTTVKHTSTPQMASGCAGVFLFVMIWFLAYIIPSCKE